MPIFTGNPTEVVGKEVFKTPTKSIVVHQLEGLPASPLVSVLPEGESDVEKLRKAQAEADAAAKSGQLNRGIIIGVGSFALVAVLLALWGRR